MKFVLLLSVSTTENLFFGTAEGGQVMCVPLKGKYVHLAAVVELHLIMLRVHGDFCVPWKDRANCWAMPPSRQCSSECPIPAQGGDTATCDPYFKPTLCWARQFWASCAAPVVGVLLPSAAPAMPREGEGFSWQRHEAAAPIVPGVNSGWLGLAELGPSVINSK